MDKRLSPHKGLLLALGASLVFVAAVRGQTPPSGQKASPESKTDPKINAAFERPDVKAYIKRFESDEREVYARRHEIVAALGLKPGMNVADIGAGTGLFTRLIAEKVGPTGKVYAVDIAPEFLAHIAADAKKHGRKQVFTVRGNQDTTNLPEQSLDLVFKAHGALVVVEFDRTPGRSSEFVLKHVRAGKDVFIKEIESAGFRQTTPTKPLALKENFIASFEKVERGKRSSQEPTAKPH
jgi:predicted methyltransferase